MHTKWTKKVGGLFLVATVTVAALTGCGGQTKTPQEETVTKNSAVNTRIVSTSKGEVEVPEKPERVVVNWYIGEVFTLGIKPIAANAWAHETMPFYDQFEGVSIIEKWEEEEIMAYDPDLIITYSEEDFEKFSKIAPVIVMPENAMTSVERLSFLGEVTGREAEAKVAIDRFENKLNEVKDTLKSDVFADKTFSIFQDWGSASYGLYYETGSRGGTLLYSYLGLNVPEKLNELIEKTGEGRGSLSYEVAADYFGDYVLWFLQEGYESEYAQTEIWKSLPAVKEGRIIELPGELMGLFYYSDLTSMSAQLDYISDKLLAIADKASVVGGN